MDPRVFASEGWVWARAARRRFDQAMAPANGIWEETDRTADLGQALEALDRTFRYVDRVTGQVQGLTLPDGLDWPLVREFARRGRDTLAHGDERLANHFGGYLFRHVGDTLQLSGQAKGEAKARTDEIEISTLDAAIDAVTAWLDRESPV